MTRMFTTMASVLLAAGLGGLALGAPTGPPSEILRSGGEPERARGELTGTLGPSHGPRRPGAAVYPRQVLPIRFDHGKHLARGLDCQRCHRDVVRSRRVSDLNLPRGVVCDDCHGNQHAVPRTEPANCEICHTQTKAGRVTATVHVPPALLRFDHAAHLARGTTCRTCHGDMSQVRLATTLQLPREATCLDCHDGIGASATCSVCHPTTTRGQLVTRARDDRVSAPLVPRGSSGWGMTHDLAFVEDHAAVAKGSPGACVACHHEPFCQDCHAGSVRPMRIHAGDYLTLHAMDARARTQDCQSCHRAQTFCLGCHERLGFGDRSTGTFGVGGGRTFHPTGWAGSPGNPQRHAFAAQRAPATCVSCHDEDSCMSCHATSGGGRPGLDVSPHGPGFAGSARCDALESRNRRVCLKCHAPGMPELDCL